MNINDQVTVKLTEAGAAALNQDRGSLTTDAREEEERSFQLWELMNIFGARCFNGGETLFVDGEIYSAAEDVSPTTPEVLELRQRLLKAGRQYEAMSREYSNHTGLLIQDAQASKKEAAEWRDAYVMRTERTAARAERTAARAHEAAITTDRTTMAFELYRDILKSDYRYGCNPIALGEASTRATAFADALLAKLEEKEEAPELAKETTP